jgi:hypothetical protein
MKKKTKKQRFSDQNGENHFDSTRPATAAAGHRPHASREHDGAAWQALLHGVGCGKEEHEK